MGVGLVPEAQDVQRVRCDIYHFRRFAILHTLIQHI